MKKSKALPCGFAALLGVSSLVFAWLPDAVGGATTRAPTIAPKRIAGLTIEQPNHPTQVVLVNAHISRPSIPTNLSAKFHKFFPLVSASIEVFESATSGGHQAKLEALGDLSMLPVFPASPGIPPYATDGGSEVNGSLLDSSGHKWTLDATTSNYNLVRGRFSYGQIAFEGRCTHVKPYTLIAGYTLFTTDCEEIEVSFFSAVETIPSNASIAIWRDYGQTTESPPTLGPVPVEGVTASVKTQYLSLSQPLDANNAPDEAFITAVIPHYKSVLNTGAKRLGGPFVAALATANMELRDDQWPTGVQVSINELIKAHKATIADIEDLPKTGHVTLAWTQKLYDDGAVAGAIDDTIRLDLGLPSG